MNIQILHSHLKEFLDTKAKPEKIAECLALCGPSVEKTIQVEKDTLYDIEITTNRVDTASVIGIAREAAAILPQFSIPAKLKLPTIKLPSELKTSPLKLFIKASSKLNKRVMAAVLEVEVSDSPEWLKKRLEAAGIRSLNNLVDITNYIMLEIGHPTHVFDYDKILSHKLVFRLSRAGEELTTLDNKTYKLKGEDIVIEDSNGNIIDLPGIMGTKNSVVDDKTKRIIFFLDNNDATLMRKTSLNLGIRTLAVQLNEKNVDPELATLAFSRGIELYQKLAKGVLKSKIFDFHPTVYKSKVITTNTEFIYSRIGVEIPTSKIKQILTDLGFGVIVNKNIEIKVPSFRAIDVDIPEDIVEEIARIYGYHNLPGYLMEGVLPEHSENLPFKFEQKVKTLLSGWGGIEVYNYSLVSKDMAGKDALKLKNPLGSDTEYLRTTLKPSMVFAAKQNNGIKEPFLLFEIANVYIPQKESLPDEKMMLAGIFANYDFRHAKGILESFLEKLHINEQEIINLTKVNNFFYFEFEMEKLQLSSRDFVSYKPLPKYPPQIEDITFEFSENLKIGEVMAKMQKIEFVEKVELIDIYKNNFTFRVYYQHPKKTLKDSEVEKIREKLVSLAKKNFGANLK